MRDSIEATSRNALHRAKRWRAGASLFPFLALLLTVAACGGAESSERAAAAPIEVAPADARIPGEVRRVVDTVIVTTTDVAGVAEPIQRAALGTKLLGTVTSVQVQEGDVVRSGQPLVQIDARDLIAKRAQLNASIADAQALQSETTVHATRLTALYADSAATRAQYDAATTALARATAGVAAAEASARELDAMMGYATVRAPFTGVVTQRLVDDGAFAAPGVPMVIVQDESRLRISATVSAGVARLLARGQSIAGTIDGVEASGTVEGVVSAGVGNLFRVNVILPNSDRRYRAGSAATLRIPGASQRAILVPLAAIVHDGDLTGVIVRGGRSDERRWVRLGERRGAYVEVSGGLRVGEQIVVPATPTSSAISRTGA